MMMKNMMINMMKCAEVLGDAAENTATEMSAEKDDVLVKAKQA